MRSTLARLLLALAVVAAASADAAAVRLKDVGYVDGVRPNQLIGYGLVVGLDGTGDSERTAFTPQSLEAMLSRLGVRIEKKQLLLRNIAAVMVTAELPAFAKPGVPIDVTVSSIGDARSLAGGTLLMTPLLGADGETYGTAQGPLKVGSEAEQESGRRYKRPKLNVGRIPGGGSVEREVAVQLGQDGVVRFLLTRPDFQTAQNVADALNGLQPTLAADTGATAPTGAPASVTGPTGAGGAAPEPMAKLLDSGTIEITVPEAWEERIPAFVARIEGLDVKADGLARVVVNGRTGTVVLGGQVRLSEAAIAYEGMTIEITPPARPAAPNAAAGGAAAAAPAQPDEKPAGLQVLAPGATLAEVVAGLNALGVSAQELVDILEALDAAGALHAKLEVQ
ncbi:MAG: flagellar basal body P-ring protein FlgI [Deltaproteobacteria bacterium]|nr:flagellar basal body P-ring protein FlgI [Deltaproteobacteria bacterium]